MGIRCRAVMPAILPGGEALDDSIPEGKLALWSTLTHLPLALR